MIRNTNTKIVLRLPDESDRMLVGKAAGTKRRANCGTVPPGYRRGAVYQNHWLEPVLCKVSYFDSEKCKPFSYYAPPFDLPARSFETSVFRILLGNAPNDTIQEQEKVRQNQSLDQSNGHGQ